MADQNSADAFEALDRVLEEIRREFRANPEFAHRVAKALGAEVFFSSDLASNFINPIELVAAKSAEDVKITLDAMGLGDLKKLVKNWQLGSAVDLNGKSKDEVIEMIEVRARRKLAARSST